MTQPRPAPAGGEAALLAALAPLAESLGWRPRSFMREGEIVAVVELVNDPSFEQVLWVSNPERATVRCLLVSRAAVAPEREAAILELCARINDGLVFGCAEFDFHDKVMVFRNSASLRQGGPGELVADATATVLDLGARYSPAIDRVLAGVPPAEAVERAESPIGG